MKGKKAIGLAIMAIAAVSFTFAAVNVYAAATPEDLSKKNKELEQRIQKLEKKILRGDTAVYQGGGSQLGGFLQDVEVHGLVDTSYVFNADAPSSPNARTNSLRVFDVESNGFMLNLMEVNIEKAVSEESPVGFRVDLAVGEDAEVFGSTGLGTTDDEFDLWQAYIQLQLPYDVPIMGEVDFKIGKFATLLGAEVIESPGNWNFSRSFLFGYAIPFNHTGVRMHFKPFEDYDLDATIGLVNGWNNVTDNNEAKTIESQIIVSPIEKLSLAMTGIFGPERDDNNSDYRSVLDFIATYELSDKLTLMLNYDYGYETNGTAAEKDATWDGVAGYAKYDVNDWWSVAARGEYFHDRDGAMTGTGVSDLGLWELTLTNAFAIYDDFLLRLEYRYDKADENVFAKNNVTSDYQNTFSVEMIYQF